MSVVVVGARRTGGWIGSRLSNFWSGINAVGIKELRGRMRGRRAFVVVTIYLALLSLLCFAVYVFMKQTAALNGTTVPLTGTDGGLRGIPFPGFDPGTGNVSATGTALSAAIGHAMFGALLAVETLLVMVLAPAFTSGAISLEREKQTLDLLVTTPLSTLGLVVGKLISALSYVFLLIIASIPLASLVFVFGAVGPEDLVRGYVELFALAFGMGALGLFISALTKRTQTATVLTYVLVLVLTIGTVALHEFWLVAARRTTSSSLVVTTRPFNAPEALLYLNPFVADADLICTTAPGADHLCEYMSQVTGKPYFGTPTSNVTGIVDDSNNFTTTAPGAGVAGASGGGVAAGGVVVVGVNQGGVFVGPDGVPLPVPVPVDCAPNTKCVVNPPAQAATSLSLGFPRDTFWPKSAAAFGVLGLVLTILAAQLVAPTRRLRLLRSTFGWRRRWRATATEPELVDAASGETEVPAMETPA